MEGDDVVFFQKVVRGVVVEHSGAAVAGGNQHPVAIFGVHFEDGVLDLRVGVGRPVAPAGGVCGGLATGEPQLVGCAAAVVSGQLGGGNPQVPVGDWR